MKQVIYNLKKNYFSETSFEILRNTSFSVELFRYKTGIEAMRVKNSRGHIVILPYYGQMIWEAVFDGVDLKMSNMFDIPRQASDIKGTYGCFLYHSGLLHNGNPGPTDTHALHGEMPLAPIDYTSVEIGEDHLGPWLSVSGEYEYLMGFGDHYKARPKILLRSNKSTFDISMEVENLAVDPMSLMYMCHANFNFINGGQIFQPTGFSNKDMIIRSSIPAIIKSSDDYLKRLNQMKEDPSATEWINSNITYNPELVFYLKNLKKATDGLVHVMMRCPSGDAFVVMYDPEDFSYLVRWILADNKQQVCAFAMPATCGVEGYTAEANMGNVRSIPGGEKVRLALKLGYLNSDEANSELQIIQTSQMTPG